MDYHTCKGTGQKISLLGFGCMRLPCLDKEQKQIDEAAATAMVDRAVAAGVNYFDTAYLYHQGASAPFIGKALSRYPRDGWYLANKLPPWSLEGPGDVERIFDEQLRKCGVDYFDFYLAHGVAEDSDEVFKKMNAYEFLARKKQEGLIRQLGFSFHDKTPVMKRVVDEHPWDFVQIQLNYIDWQMLDAEGQYEFLTERGIPVVVMEPVRGGLLAAPGEAIETALKRVDPAAAPAALALRFAASLPGVLTVLSGMSNLAQVEENIATFSPLRPLSETARGELETIGANTIAKGNVPCTECRYCMDCPAGVDIPEVLGIWNYCLADPGRVAGDWNYGNLEPARRANACTGCGECVKKCPQHIDIPGVMGKITG